MTTAADAIRSALEALGGEADARDVKDWVEARFPGQWEDITVQMADLTYPGTRRRLTRRTSDSFDG